MSRIAILIIQSIVIELKIWFFDEIDTKSYIRNGSYGRGWHGEWVGAVCGSSMAPGDGERWAGKR